MFRMFENLSLGAILMASASLFAQNQPGSMSHAQPGGMVQPATPPVVVVPSSPSIYVVGGGLYGTGVYLVNPGTLPLQSTGISMAGRTGISLETPLQTGAFTGAPSLYQGGQPNYSAWPNYGGYSTDETQAPESGRLIYDMGPSVFGGDEPGTEPEAAPLPSLGEIAAQYRAHHTRAVRTFTNEDAQRLSNTIAIGAGHVTPPPPPPPPQENKPKERKPPDNLLPRT